MVRDAGAAQPPARLWGMILHVVGMLGRLTMRAGAARTDP